MTIRTLRETVTFNRPFRIKGIDRQLAAGAYQIVNDEELIEGLSFPCYRRIATMIMVPAAHGGATEMISIDAAALTAARQSDASAASDASKA
jgi:hypothetical protein